MLALTHAYFSESGLFKDLRAIQIKKFWPSLQLASEVASKPVARSILSCSLGGPPGRRGFCCVKYIA
jgi:hypothetical protein